MEDTSIWNDTFTVEYTYAEDLSKFAPSSEDMTTYTETYTGSLKELHRLVLEERRHGRASVSFYNSNGEWLKTISY